MLYQKTRQEVRKQLYSILAVFAVGVIVMGLFFFRGVQEEALAADHKASVDLIHVLVNQEREAQNLPPLQWNDQLAWAAQKKAEDMAANSYFAHVSPVDGKKWSEFILEAGYDYREAGENLAVGFTNPQEIVQAWMDSPSHRENILAVGFEEGGLGLTVGEWKGRKTYFIAHEFGRK